MATAAPSRPRAGGGRLFIIIGVVVALLAGGLVFFLSTLGGGGGGIGGGSTQNVVVARQTIPLRHTITLDDIELKAISTNIPNKNLFSKTSDVKDLTSQITISAGSVITSDMLARDLNAIPLGLAPRYLPLPAGYVAMTIPTGEQQGVAGNITLGDYIAVIASANLTIFNVGGVQAPGPPKVVSKTVFTQVHVIGLGPAAPNVQPAGGGTAVGGQQGVSGGVVSSLTIELTECDAEFFTWFLQNTQLRYTLESNKDYLQAVPPPPASCATVDLAHGVSQVEVEARYHFTAL